MNTHRNDVVVPRVDIVEAYWDLVNYIRAESRKPNFSIPEMKAQLAEAINNSLRPNCVTKTW